MQSVKPQTESPWPHRASVALVCATFPLIWVGGLVTTTQAGMAVPDWPDTYGYNLFLYPWTSWILGPWDLFIEHGHRLLGAMVGLLTILAAGCIWRYDRRWWLKLFAGGAILAVIAQGVLGGMRVLLDARTLAMIHGCTGPAFFGVAVALAAFTSRWWKNSREPISNSGAETLQSVAVLTAAFAFVQLMLGARVRHITPFASPDSFQAAVAFHLGMAAILTVHVVWLVALVWRGFRVGIIARPANLLAGLMLLQLVLGLQTWIVKFGWPGWMVARGFGAANVVDAGSFYQSSIITGHVAVGSLILAISILIALRSLRLYRAQPSSSAVHLRSFLGVVA